MPVDLSVFDRQKSIVDQQQLQQAFEAKKQAAQLQAMGTIAELQKSARGGDLPAPIKVANRMFELQQIATNPALTPQERQAANTQYNLLGQSAKTFGFDRGIEYNMQPQFPALPPIEQPQQQGTVGAKPRDSKMPLYTPPQGEDIAIDASEYIDLPQSPQGTDFSQYPDLQPLQTPRFSNNIQPISGYGSAVGDIAATKAGMEENAKLQEQLGLKPKIESATLDAKYLTEGRQKLPKMERSLKDMELAKSNIFRVADKSRQQAERAFTTGFTGSIMDAVAGTPAFDLKQNLLTLEASAAFSSLQTMRDNSPTGGALGQVTERELDLLKAAYSNLVNSQSKEQFLENLSAFEAQQESSLANARIAYEQDYARFGGGSDTNLPSPTERQRGGAQPETQAPEGAVNFLLQNPNARGDFDAKYGAGASAKILGQ